MEKVKDICRLCLDPTSPENSGSVMEEEMRSKLQVVFNFELIEQETFPCGVCSECSAKVEEFHYFHEKVRCNQAQLKTVSDQRAKLQCSPINDVKEEPSLIVEDPSTRWSDSDSDHEAEMTVKKDDRPTTPQEVKEEPDCDSDESEVSEEPVRKKRKQRTVKLKSEPVENEDISEEKTKKLQDENSKIQEFFTMTCESCSETFETFDRLQRHTRKAHKSRGSIKCCNRVFYKKCKIIDHINSHLNPNQFHCDVCNKSYNSKYYLDLHNLKKHSISDEKPFKCDKCSQGFPKEYLLKAHLSTHIQVECELCHRTLASASTLRSHMANMHSGNTKHICDTCGQEFRTKLAMERHIKQHLGINPIERIQCHICSKWVNGKPNLKVHIKTVHNEENQAVPCDVCQQIYPNMRALSSHKRRVHVEEKFECEFCGKKFKRSIYLKEHRASHTGQSLYSCDVCGMTTNSNANLYSHKKSKHPDEWMEAKKKAMANAYG